MDLRLLLSQDLFPIAGVIIPAVGIDLCAVGGGVYSQIRGIGSVGEVAGRAKREWHGETVYTHCSIVYLHEARMAGGVSRRPLFC
jgi:hypothetical protein